MYLNQFNKVKYNFKGTSFTDIEVLDIMKRVAFKFEPYVSTIRPTEVYIPSVGDTVDSIAENYYGDAEYWWLVCLFNNIINPFSAMPRTGKDEDFMKSNSQTRVAYLERSGGDRRRDIQTGDVIVLCSSTDTVNEVVLPNGIRYYNVPKPLTNSFTHPLGADSPKYVARIADFNRTLRKAYITGEHANRFNVTGAKYVVFSSLTDWNKTFNFQDAEDNNIITWGEVKKTDFASDAIVGFIQKNNNNYVDAMTNHKTGVRWTSNYNPASQSGDLEPRPTLNWSYENTLIGGYLGFSGEAGSTWDERYEAVTRSDEQVRSSQGAGFKTKLRLLIPQYKNEAYELFKSSLNDNRFSIYEYTSAMNEVRNTDVNYLL